MPRAFLIKKRVKCKSPLRCGEFGVSLITSTCQTTPLDLVKVCPPHDSPGQISEDSGIEEIGDSIPSPERKADYGSVSPRAIWKERWASSPKSHLAVAPAGALPAPASPGAPPLPPFHHRHQQQPARQSENITHCQRPIASQVENRLHLGRRLAGQENQDDRPDYGLAKTILRQQLLGKGNRVALQSRDNEENQRPSPPPYEAHTFAKAESGLTRSYLPYGYPPSYPELGVVRERTVLRYAPYHVGSSLPRAELGAASKAEPEARVELMVESRCESKSEPRLESRSESRLESRSMARSESRLEPRLESRFQPLLEPRCESRLEPPPESRLEPRSDSRLDSMLVSKSDLRSEPWSDLRSESYTRLSTLTSFHAVDNPRQELYREEGLPLGSPPHRELLREELPRYRDVMRVRVADEKDPQMSPPAYREPLTSSTFVQVSPREVISISSSEGTSRGVQAWEGENMPVDLNGRGDAKRHRNEAPRFQCEDCHKSYATFSGLTKHKQFHCSAQVKKEFHCKHCDRPYVSLGALKMHIRTHTLPCKCHLCGKAFSRPWLLQGHVRTHTGEKPFKCEHCGRAFADRSNLRAHLQTHSEVKKYNCKSCAKTFSRMSLLTKHEEGGCLQNVY